MNRLLLFPLLLIIIATASCGRVDCITQTTAVSLSFTGYEADSGLMVIISKLAANSSTVAVQRDTFLIDSNRVCQQIRDATGLRLVSAYPAVYAGANWQVEVPATGERDVISGIAFTSDTRKKELIEGGGWGNQCINVCTGYYLNGNYVATGYNTAVSYGGSTGVSIELHKH